MSISVNSRLRAAAAKEIATYTPASATSGLHERMASISSLSEEESDNIQWARAEFGCNVIQGLHVARLEPNPVAERASFFSAAAVPMRVVDTPFVLPTRERIDNGFHMPVYVIAAPKWYPNDFNAFIMGGTRFPNFDSKQGILSFSKKQQERVIYPVEITEAFVAILWESMSETLNNPDRAPKTLLVARSTKIYLKEYPLPIFSACTAAIKIIPISDMKTTI